MNDNNNLETLSNYSSNDDLLKYNEELTEKQKVQKGKIELIKQNVEKLDKDYASYKSGSDRSGFKRITFRCSGW